MSGKRIAIAGAGVGVVLLVAIAPSGCAASPLEDSPRGEHSNDRGDSSSPSKKL
ncbi:hypothetical protein BDW74DRAFT_141919 [Aspergillus multicolor]|uniref:uncharacterized protein n=1 Tax=Aspergillus multicolor TaxID=41759 RepID=UPI003CCE113B